MGWDLLIIAPNTRIAHGLAMSWVFIFSGDVQGLTDCGCFCGRCLKGVSGHLTSRRTFVITPLGSPPYATYTLHVDLP